MLRCLANRFFGAGPWRLAPFATIARSRTDEVLHGVHRVELFSGVVRTETEPEFFYGTRVALLGQTQQPQRDAEGVRYLSSGIVASPMKKLLLLTDAGIAGRDGVVYCPRTRTAVAETVRCWTASASTHPLLSAMRFPPAEKLPGLSLTLATLDAEGFYHFLLEAIPRIALVRERLSSIDHFLLSGARSNWAEAWLALAGVPAEKIRWLHPLAHFRCEQLLLTNRIISDCQPTPWVQGALRRTLRAPRRSTGDLCLWISRTDACSRHVVWEDQLLAQFPKFVKVILNGRPPSEQIDLFSRAAVVAGPHGAGLANLIFSPPGVRLIEFFPNFTAIPLYGRVAQVSGGEAAWLTTNFSQPNDLEIISEAMSGYLR